MTVLEPVRLVNEALAEARKKETEYDWITAATIYKKIFSEQVTALDPVQKVLTLQQLAKSFFKAAFQAETRDEFKERMKQAGLAYETLGAIYDSRGAKTWSNLVETRRLYTAFWVSDAFDERSKILEGCITLSESCAGQFEEQADQRGLVETRKDLLSYYMEYHSFVQSNHALQQLFAKSVAISEYVTSEFKNVRDDQELLEVLFLSINLMAWCQIAFPRSMFAEFVGKANRLTEEIVNVSTKIGTPFSFCLASLAQCLTAQTFDENMAKALKICLDTIPVAEKLHDSYLIGHLYTSAAVSYGFLHEAEDSAEGQREVLENQVSFGETGLKFSQISMNGLLIDVSYWNLCFPRKMLALRVETNLEKKRAYLREAIELARQGMKYNAYSPTGEVASSLSGALHLLATVTHDKEEKALLLNEALVSRNEVLSKAQRVAAPDFWNIGRDHNLLATVTGELAKIEVNPAKKIQLLKDAVVEMERCLGICTRWSTPGLLPDLALFEERYGDILMVLHKIEQQEDTVEAAIKNYGDAIGNIQKFGTIGPIAGLRWKLAKAYDTIYKHVDSSRTYREAAIDYRALADKIPASATSFQDLASFMEACALVEEARKYHSDEQYSFAAAHYGKAAAVLESTASWRQLGAHYKAVSLLAEGEHLGQTEKPELSMESLARARISFLENMVKLEDRLREGPVAEQEQEVKDLISSTSMLEKICLGKIELEHAKVLDKKGDDEKSASKYESASAIFRNLLMNVAPESSQAAVQALVHFSDAWTKMKTAELDTSPEKYREAASHFRHASEMETGRRSHFLALGNASICDALEQGARFYLTHDSRLYSEIKKHLSAASDQYERGGFESATEWTRATQRLFDALVYVTDAETERDPQKKSELYHYAEKYLDMSAKLYSVAGYLAKKNTVDKLLKRVREDKQLLLSPMDALKENPAVSQAIVTPLPLTRDEAPGPERFELARVVGSITLQPKEGAMETDFVVELEMVNIGKGPATLVKIENLAPDGLKIQSGTRGQVSGETWLDLRGKRLSYLKTHKERIHLKAQRQGGLDLSLKLLFVDETGEYRSYDFQHVQLTVTGPNSALGSSDSAIMSFLSKAFVEDYMVRRLAVEHAGWRSLMDIVASLKIPKAQVYGDSRYGHTFGKPLEELVKAGIVEYRITPGVRGRGGNVMKIRVAYEREPVKKLVDELALRPLRHSQVSTTT